MSERLAQNSKRKAISSETQQKDKRIKLGHTSYSGSPVGKHTKKSNGLQMKANGINGSRNGTPKKLVIKNFKVKPSLPANFEDETWAKLEASVKAIHAREPVAYSLESLFQATENLCNHKLAANVYSKLEAQCKKNIEVEVKKMDQQTSDPEPFLQIVNTCWASHCSQMLLIRDIFLYLDRTYVIQNATIRSLWDMGLQLFRQQLELSPNVLQKITNSILVLITKERKGDAVNRGLLQNLLRMLTSLQIYDSSFEKPFLDATERFYASEGVDCLREYELSLYLDHVSRRLNEEVARYNHYLDRSTRNPLIRVVETQLLAALLDQMIHKGFDALLKDDKHENLKLMYSLFKRVNGDEKLQNAFNAYIKSTGTAMITDAEKDKTMMEDLLSFKQKIDVICEKCFDNSEEFAYSGKKAFESFINTRQNKPAELMAKFVDEKLRTGNRKKVETEEELENLLDRVMVIFRFIHGKDVFEAFYKKDLAKRVLLGKSASIDAEKSMISKLKSECGSSFTNKLEGMFKDIDISNDVMAQFSETEEAKSMKCEMQVSVLTAGYWPPYPLVEVKLPTELAEYQNLFKKFYLNKHSGRRLLFQNSLGHCVLSSYFPKAKKELSVSFFQCIVLLLWTPETQSLTYKEIHESTGIDHKELRRTLQSLSLGKFRPLLKGSKGKDIADEDVFDYNKDFSAKLFRLKINAIQMRETEEEHKKTTTAVFQDRQYQIDAAIVRIMKTRKTLSHPLLMAELYSQLKFPLKPVDAKKRIESLIDREYLQRDKDNAQQYEYMA